MSWLMYATRSTSRTIFPSSDSGSRSPVCVRIPSQTSWVRLSERAIRSDCSLWRNRRPKRSCSASSSASSPGVPERRVSHVVPEPDRLDEVLVQPQRPRDDARDRSRLERVGHARAVVVAFRVDEDLRLPLQPPERLRVDDAVAVALERRPDARTPPPAARGPRVSSDLHRERRQARLELPDSLLESAHQMMMGTVPPSALHAAPVTYDARSEQRKTITAAISSGRASRPSGRPAPTFASTSSRSPC